MKKILYIHHATGWGGPTNSLIQLINGLDNSKYELKVLLLKYSSVAEKLAENDIKYTVAKSLFYKKYYQFFPHSEAGYIKWYQFYSFINLSILWLLSRYVYAKKELDKHDFDIIHLNSSVLTDWLAPSKKKGKVIIHIREPFRNGKFDFLHSFFKSQMKSYADKIIAISYDNAKRIDIPDKTEIVYNFAEIPKTLPIENSYASKKVLYLGGSSTSKGFYTIVDALEYIDKDIFVYFGGHYSKSVRMRTLKQLLIFLFSRERKRNAAFKKISVYPNAILIGLIHNTQDYFDQSCCLVSPFLVPHFARPVIEAHLHQKAAIGSDVEGMDEIIEHEKNGLLFPKNNPKALATAINKLANNPDKIKRFGIAGYKIAIQKFTSNNSRQIESIYDHL